MIMYKGFGGGFGGGNMQQLMRQAQKMQQDMVAKQEAIEKELGETVLSASTAGGMVTLEITGKREIVSLKIKPEAVDPDDVEMLEDMVVACLNDGLNKVAELENKLNGDMPKLNGLM